MYRHHDRRQQLTSRICSRRDHIRINAICPSITDSPMTTDIIHIFKQMGQSINTCDDVAKYIVGLEIASDMNGKAIYVEGGRGWEVIDGLDASIPVWCGEEPTQRLKEYLEHVGQVGGSHVCTGSVGVLTLCVGRWRKGGITHFLGGIPKLCKALCGMNGVAHAFPTCLSINLYLSQSTASQSSLHARPALKLSTPSTATTTTSTTPLLSREKGIPPRPHPMRRPQPLRHLHSLLPL